MFRFDISPEAKILELDNIERVSQEQLKEYEEVDYNALPDESPEDFAVLREAKKSPEAAKKEFERISNTLQKKIDAENEKKKKETDFNKIADIEDTVAALTEQKRKIDDVVQKRYAQKEESIEGKTQLPTDSRAKEGEKLNEEQAQPVTEAVSEENKPSTEENDLTPEMKQSQPEINTSKEGNINEGTVINTPKHNITNIKEAKNWAKENIAGTYKNDNTGEYIRVSNSSIDK